MSMYQVLPIGDALFLGHGGYSPLRFLGSILAGPAEL
jgi:hypothetical protein